MVTARYKITEDALIFEAGLLSTAEEIVPLWAVMDVDLRQSMMQKPRDVGDLVVRLDPAGSKYGQVTVKLESIKDPRSVRDLLARQANIMRSAMLNRQHERDIQRRQAGAGNINIGSPGAPQPSAEPTAVPAALAVPPIQGSQTADEIMAQIRKLGELRDAGILTDAEFETKKAELLARL